ncbi:hypothetical protein HBI55_254540 [Parastagonospora nodorum]|nr:hypothetical protein HBI28_251430 [Parastagonospora nodorum]KAH5617597.1 hypothetical protein HBI22_252180 [Parastagonospora nodorum]KAH5706843.1 hypothetical protein HBI18_252130 [Parastagonospora nodorum]KAH6073857.1 hypothetical protein HBI65_240020 [Parastagonospora nodorum]KAH6480323.1 hypothetical protein HBI55_254540 [Parastagonospora nodorum]
MSSNPLRAPTTRAAAARDQSLPFHDPQEESATAQAQEVLDDDIEDLTPITPTEELGMEATEPDTAQPANNEPQGPISPRLDQEEDEMRKEIEELRQLKARALLEEELVSLRAMKARYDLGDREAFNPKQLGTTPPGPSQSNALGSLPKPEPPTRFEKKNRAQYNRWERDCESYFVTSPRAFPTEASMVAFGLRYVSENMRTLWDSHCSPSATSLGWTPTWVELKAVMLNSLGTPAERFQEAYDRIRLARQKPNQSPTDLLDYLRPLWEELGLANTEVMKVTQYYSALRQDIQDDLAKIPVERRSTLATLEEQANMVWRRVTRHRTAVDIPVRTPHSRPRKVSPNAEGARNPPKKAKHTGMSHNGPKRALASGAKSDHSKLTCYNCNKVGHISPDCPNPRKPQAGPSQRDTGKDNGRRS